MITLFGIRRYFGFWKGLHFVVYCYTFKMRKSLPKVLKFHDEYHKLY